MTKPIMPILLLVVVSLFACGDDESPPPAATEPPAPIGAEITTKPLPTPYPTYTPLPSYTPVPTHTPYPTYTPMPTAAATAVPTYVPYPTQTSLPTYTPYPTYTPVPTWTPLPTATPTPAPTAPPTPTAIPEPIVWSLNDIFNIIVQLDKDSKLYDNEYRGKIIRMETRYDERKNYGLRSFWRMDGKEPIPITRRFSVTCVIDKEDFSWFEKKEPYRSIVPRLHENTLITYEGRLSILRRSSSHTILGIGLSWTIALEDCRVVSVDGEPVLHPL